MSEQLYEAAIKLARLHTEDGRYKIITFTGGFHGRTLGATTGPITVSFTTGGTAVTGTDYSSVGTSVVIPDAALTADVTITSSRF